MSVDVRPIKTAAEGALAASFALARANLPGADKVAALRDEAFRRFEADGLPNRRIEEWKYTDLRALMREAKPLAPLPDAAAKRLPPPTPPPPRRAGQRLPAGSIEARRIVFVNGSFVPELSDLADLEPGLVVRSMASALGAGDPRIVNRIGKIAPTGDTAVALNTAFMGDGAVIEVAPGAALSRPIQLAFFNGGSDSGAVFMRSLAVIGKGAGVMLGESHEGAGEFQVNTALELEIGDTAHGDHIKITRTGSLHVSSLMTAVGAQARFNEFLFTIGG